MASSSVVTPDDIINCGVSAVSGLDSRYPTRAGVPTERGESYQNDLNLRLFNEQCRKYGNISSNIENLLLMESDILKLNM